MFLAVERTPRKLGGRTASLPDLELSSRFDRA